MMVDTGCKQPWQLYLAVSPPVFIPGHKAFPAKRCVLTPSWAFGVNGPFIPESQRSPVTGTQSQVLT
eukprot:765208-Hanusia_phi.AAC.1